MKVLGIKIINNICRQAFYVTNFNKTKCQNKFLNGKVNFHLIKWSKQSFLIYNRLCLECL